MVDRITPVTTDAGREAIAEELGIEDAWPVVCEPFEQWVLEDNFGLGRPPFEDAGVQLVEDVEPYELMKLRLLNASHQGLCYFGYRYAHEVCQDPLFTQFLLDYMDKEATPTLQPVPGIDLSEASAKPAMVPVGSLIRRSVDVKTVPLVPIDTATSPGLRVKPSAAPALSPHPAATRVPVAVVPAVAEGSITVGRSGDLPNAHSTRSCR